MTPKRKPHIPNLSPVTVELETGVYQWCTCGHAYSQPFCDMSCEEIVGFMPCDFEIHRTKRCNLCQCKHTKTPPYCDNSHTSGEVRQQFFDQDK